MAISILCAVIIIDRVIIYNHKEDNKLLRESVNAWKMMWEAEVKKQHDYDDTQIARLKFRGE